MKQNAPQLRTYVSMDAAEMPYAELGESSGLCLRKNCWIELLFSAKMAASGNDGMYWTKPSRMKSGNVSY